MDAWYEAPLFEHEHLQVQRALEGARRLGVRVMAAPPELMEKVAHDDDSHISMSPLGGADFNLYCTMGHLSSGKRGAVWAYKCPLPSADYWGTPIRRDPFELAGALYHDIAHAVVGPDEEACTALERPLAKAMKASRKAYKELVATLGDVDPAAWAWATQRLIEHELLVPSGRHGLGMGRLNPALLEA